MASSTKKLEVHCAIALSRKQQSYTELSLSQLASHTSTGALHPLHVPLVLGNCQCLYPNEGSPVQIDIDKFPETLKIKSPEIYRSRSRFEGCFRDIIIGL